MATSLRAQDECSTATPIALGANGPFDSTGSTVSAPTWSCGFVSGGDVWYSYTTPALGGLMTVDTEGTTGISDTVLEVFNACGGTVVACDDDGGTGALSTVTFAANGSTTYFIRVAGYASAVGVHNVNVAYTSPDECTGAIAVADGLNGPFNTTGATTSLPLGTCAGINTDIWLKHTASCNGTLTVNTESPGTTTLTDTVMQAWSACGGTVLACDDDGGPGAYSQFSFAVTAGTTYFFRVGDFGATSPVAGAFNIRVVNTPTVGGFPDNCACAAPLALGANAVDNTGATASTPAPTCGVLSSTGGDLWYTYTVAGPGCSNLTIDTVGSGVDTVLEVWDACGGSVLDCNDDIVFPPGESSVTLTSLPAGTAVTVRAWRYGSAFGPFTINVAETSGAPADDESTGATPIVLGLNAGLDNLCCTPSTPGLPCSFNGSPVSDKWFTFTAGCTAPHTFSTCSGALNDTVLEVLDSTLASLACNDDACGLRSELTVSLTNGTTYFVRCGGWNNSFGSFDINVETGTGTGTIVPSTTISLCPSGATLSVTGNPNIGNAITIAVSGNTGLGLVAYGFLPNATVPSPCGCDLVSGVFGPPGELFFSSSITVTIPCDAALIGVQAELQGLDAFPTSGGCTFVGIPFGATDITTMTVG